jgi:sugar lactone lactonase YvrE
MIVGQGEFTYELAEGWEQIPAGWRHGDVVNVATDSRDRVYVFNRSEHPVMVYERDGRFLGSWGEGVFTRAHGITITPDDVVYCTDDKDHTVRKFTLDGKLRQTIGTPHQPSDTGYVDAGPIALTSIRRGAGPFNRPTRVFKAPSGRLYVTDGYGNARVHRFWPDGELFASWGEPGDAPGQFNLPHSVWVHEDGRVFVCDRENDRVQIFDLEGRYRGAWTNVTRPADLAIDAQGNVYLGELAWEAGTRTMAGRPIVETRPSQVTVRDLDGNVRARWGGPDPFEPASFASAHGVCVDRHGDVYVAEVAETALGRAGRYRPDFPSLKKFVRRR